MQPRRREETTSLRRKPWRRRKTARRRQQRQRWCERRDGHRLEDSTSAGPAIHKTRLQIPAWTTHVGNDVTRHRTPTKPVGQETDPESDACAAAYRDHGDFRRQRELPVAVTLNPSDWYIGRSVTVRFGLSAVAM